MSDPLAPPMPAKRRPWRRRVFLALVGLVILVWALPPIVARSPALGLITARLGPRLHGSVTVSEASLGWFSPVVLRDVELRDKAGRRLVAIAEAESEYSLLALMLHPGQVGTLHLRRPQFEVAFAGRHTDLEQVFVADVETATEVAAARPFALPQVRVEIADASVKITDTDRNLAWELHALNGTVDSYADAERTCTVRLEGDGTAGSLKLAAKLQHIGEPAFHAEMKGKFVAFPLAIASAVARRFQSDTELTGLLDGHCQLSAALRDDAPQVQFAGEAVVRRCEVASPLLQERLCLDRVQFPCKVKLDGSRLHFEQAEVTCDLGQAALRGELDLEAGLDRPGLAVNLHLDLARVAEKLPRTLRLHRDLRLTAGKLDLESRSTAGPDGTRWEGRLDMSDLHGIKGERPVAWTDPIKIAFQARHVGRGLPLLDHVNCSSRFLRIDGAARPTGFDLQLDADLQQLMEPLGEFVDLGPVRLAGQAHGKVAVQAQPDGSFVVDGDARLDRFDLRGLTPQAWQEETVTLKLSARGQSQQGHQRLDAATATARFGTDALDVRLLEPFADLARLGGLWDVRAEGELARWQRRGLAWTGLVADQRLAGTVQMQARLRPTPTGVECPGAGILVRDLQCLGTTLHIREPELMLETAGRWLPDGTLDLIQTTVRCPTLTLETARLRLQPATLTAQGSANVRGDVARLRHWLQATDAAPLTGAVSGRLDLDGQDERCGLTFDLQLDNLNWAPPGKTAWQEPRVNLSGQGHYEHDRDLLQLTRVRGGSQYLAWDAHGQLSNLATTKNLDLSGQLAFDLQKLEPHLRPYLGKDGHIAGTSARAFTLAGPLAPRPGELHVTALKGEMGLSWQAVRMHGCDVGPADIRACLQQGWFQLYPVETTLNEGKLHLQPNVRLEPGPAELVLLGGPVVEKARLTPELCAGALGYLVPGLAGSAQADGLISISLDGGRLPLGAPATGELQGTVIVHSARVSPGPVASELAILLRGAAEATIPAETRIPFQMIKGRVYHRDLQLAFPDLTIRSSGSVGLDGSLALMLEMPVPPRWLGSGKLSAALANKTIRVPLGGTLARPRLDQAALRQLNAEFAGDAVRNEVERGLQRLFRPRN